MAIHEIIERLHGATKRGTGWQARCPAHTDSNPSLSIREEDGKILLHCHAGCSTEAVLKALGLTFSDLYEGRAGERRITENYPYVDESGRLLFEVVRYSPKGFRQRRRSETGAWIWNLEGVRRVLYRLPEITTSDDIVVLEGEKDVATARTLGLVATCNPGGAGKWNDEYSEILRGKRVVVISDADDPGRKHARQVRESLLGKVASVRVIELPGAKDLTDWVERGGNLIGLQELIQRSSTSAPPAAPSLRVVSIAELLTMDIKPREMTLHAFLPAQGLAMLYSKRGVGKTYISLGISVAVASGGEFLTWKAPCARRVLYVDGEMPCSSLQERLSSIIAGSKTIPEDDSLRIITPDLQDRSLPDLASLSGQEMIEEHLEGVSLLVLDNLSALVRAGKENEGEGWLPVQDWALGLRRRGISVLFVHHAGKSGSQRGTSRREDLLDSVITLKHPSDYTPSDGLRCEVHYEKTRGFFGEEAKPFEVRMQLGDRKEANWIVSGPTLRGVRATISTVLQSAVERGYVHQNPAHGIRLRDTRGKAERRYYTPAVIQKLLPELSEPCRTVVTVAVLTGLRIGEILALRWKRVDMLRDTIEVTETFSDGQFGSPKTRSSRRVIPVSESLRKILEAHRSRSIQKDSEDLVFTTPTGTPLSSKNLYNRVLAPACDRIKEPRVSWHSFRHAHATLLAESGESMKTAQALLGHSDLETTLNVYTHALPTSQRRAVERVSEVMFSIVLELGENEQEGKSN